MNNPGRPKGTIKTVKYMNPDELDRFLLTAKKIGMKENFMFTLMYDLALRIGELKQINLNPSPFKINIINFTGFLYITFSLR